MELKLSEFIDRKKNFSRLVQVEQVKYMAFFYTKVKKDPTFTPQNVKDFFDLANLPSPANIHAIFYKLKEKNIFILVRGVYRLHRDIKKQLEKEFSIDKPKKDEIPIITKGFIEPSYKYPEIFYQRLEDEINVCYNTDLLNAALVLSRKMVENLVYNLFEYKFEDINLRWNTNKNRPHDFAKLIDNLKDKKEEFNQEQQSIIDRFLELVYPFRRIANSKAHNIMVYVNSKEEVDNLKIPEIIELVLKLIDKVRR